MNILGICISFVKLVSSLIRSRKCDSPPLVSSQAGSRPATNIVSPGPVNNRAPSSHRRFGAWCLRDDRRRPAEYQRNSITLAVVTVRYRVRRSVLRRPPVTYHSTSSSLPSLSEIECFHEHVQMPSPGYSLSSLASLGRSEIEASIYAGGSCCPLTFFLLR